MAIATLMVLVVSSVSTGTSASSLVAQIHKLRDRASPLSSSSLQVDLTALSSHTLLCTMRLLVQKKDTLRMLELLPLYFQKTIDDDGEDLYICGLMLDALKVIPDKDGLALIAKIQLQQQQMPSKSLDLMMEELQFAWCLKHSGERKKGFGLSLKQTEHVLKYAQTWPSVARLRTALLQRERVREGDNMTSSSYVSAVSGLALLEAVNNDRSNELACLLAKKDKPTSQGKAYSHVVAFLDDLIDSSTNISSINNDNDNADVSDWKHVQQLVFDQCNKKPSQLKHFSWDQLRTSQILDNYCTRFVEEQQGTSSLLLHISNQCKQIMLLGEGDFSFATSLCSLLSSQQQQPLHTTVHATSLEDQQQVEKKYKSASSNIELLSAMENTFVHFNVDATQIPLSFASMEVDLFLFMFPFADAALPASNSSLNSSFDTHYIAKRRHIQLLDGFFASINNASSSRKDVQVGISLLLSQAVAWNIENIASSYGFALSSMSPFNEQCSLYQRRRSYNDDTFPQGQNSRKSSSVLFFFTKSK